MVPLRRRVGRGDHDRRPHAGVVRAGGFDLARGAAAVVRRRVAVVALFVRAPRPVAARRGCRVWRRRRRVWRARVLRGLGARVQLRFTRRIRLVRWHAAEVELVIRGAGDDDRRNGDEERQRSFHEMRGSSGKGAPHRYDPGGRSKKIDTAPDVEVTSLVTSLRSVMHWRRAGDVLRRARMAVKQALRAHGRLSVDHQAELSSLHVLHEGAFLRLRPQRPNGAESPGSRRTTRSSLGSGVRGGRARRKAAQKATAVRARWRSSIRTREASGPTAPSTTLHHAAADDRRPRDRDGRGVASPDGLHPVQDAMVAHYGSQCGYCTPGFVLSMFEAYYRTDIGEGEQAKLRIGDQLNGNLCRCTGYRPIREAMVDALGRKRPSEDLFQLRLKERRGDREARIREWRADVPSSDVARRPSPRSRPSTVPRPSSSPEQRR